MSSDVLRSKLIILPASVFSKTACNPEGSYRSWSTMEFTKGDVFIARIKSPGVAPQLVQITLNVSFTAFPVLKKFYITLYCF